AGCATTGPDHLAGHHVPARRVTIAAEPRSLEMDPRRTAVIVVDMQNDFLAKGGLLDRVGVDVIVDELKPRPGYIVVYKTRYIGFHNTDLDAILKRHGVTTLIMTGCTTSVCVESTLRDAMSRDYSPVLLADCTAEILGLEFPRNNHEATLHVVREAPL